jgi:hypothetical protein
LSPAVIFDYAETPLTLTLSLKGEGILVSTIDSPGDAVPHSQPVPQEGERTVVGAV